jgi:uncharacterized protein (TIGR02246 family)
MSTRTILTLLALLPIAAFIAAAAPARPSGDDDIAAIKKNTAAFTAAWNKHDAKALAALWAKDGDLIDPWGVTSVGRDAVEKFFAEQHTGNGKLAHSGYDNKSDSVRLITPDVAIEDWQVVLTGLSDPSGKPLGPQMHHVVIIHKKDAGHWLIAAARPGVPSPVIDAVPAKQTK